jgi:iron complex outermembrane receptor protein
MKNTPFILSVFGIFLVIPFNQGLAEPVEDLDDIIVSATRWETAGIPTAGSISVITRSQIIESGAARVIDVLRGQGGVQVRDLYGDGSRATVDMRGFGDSAGANTLILVDGRRLNNTDLHAPDLNFISIKDIERIEIIQGSAAVLYGDQATGGVINIITRRPDKLDISAYAGYGSYGHQLQVLNLSNRFENGIGVRASAERRLSDNYRNNNDLEYLNGFASISYDGSRGSVFAELQRTDEELGVPGALFADELRVSRTQTSFPMDFNNSVAGIFRTGGTFSITPDWDVAGEYTRRDEDVDGHITFSSGFGFDFAQKRLHQSVNPRVRGIIPFGAQRILLVAGADIEKTDYKLAGFTSSEQDMKSVYAQVTLPVNEIITVAGGLRKAWVENRIVTFMPIRPEDHLTASTFSVIVTPDQAWHFFIKREDNYRIPLVDEQTDVFFSGLPELKTQTGTSYEAGAEWRYQRFSSRLAGYVLKLENELAFNPLTGPFGQNVNLEPTRRTGIILDFAVTPADSITVGAKYTFTDAEFENTVGAGDRVPLVAEHQLQLSAIYRFLSHWSLYAEALLVSDRVASGDIRNEFAFLAGYGTGNMNLRYDNGHWNINARINNILDKEYSESAGAGFNPGTGNMETGFYPAPERNFMLTLGYEF